MNESSSEIKPNGDKPNVHKFTISLAMFNTDESMPQDP